MGQIIYGHFNQQKSSFNPNYSLTAGVDKQNKVRVMHKLKIRPEKYIIITTALII